MPYRFWKNEDGATAIEYGMIVALIGVGILGALTGTSSNVVTMWTNNSAEISEAMRGTP
ncbi:Flp family type IVb pilin [Aliihoeflea aestuarii]|jgi:pilus assembly protein Flp/PilA|uniref:Flp family type IVb pilin n=1 Tax=Aliihoeflea aestuarii TaxID=453840 RepID=UPI0020961C51|nr:Flp family type IVb pilin [Aliihoeflea aestuarii]MCO6392550.1 Flp family type IVb pilin [Aliihoeflea aestuarii]